jgi:hypothetical protein
VTPQLFEFVWRSDHLAGAIQASLFFFSSHEFPHAWRGSLDIEQSNTSPISIPLFSKSSFAIKCSGLSATPLGIIVVRETGIPQPDNRMKNSNTGAANLIMRRL